MRELEVRNNCTDSTMALPNVYGNYYKTVYINGMKCFTKNPSIPSNLYGNNYKTVYINGMKGFSKY